MAPLRAAAAAIALTMAMAAPAQARSDAVARWAPLIAEASQRFGIPAAWIERVMRAESGGETSLNGRPITSRAGAMGLMQLMPGTWAEIRSALGLGSDPHEPRDNILAGTFYLRLMYQRFGYPGLFGAYNAGPGCYAAYLAGVRPLPSETQSYLVSVAGAALGTRPTALTAKPMPVLFVIERGRSAGDITPLPQTPEGLFAIRAQH